MRIYRNTENLKHQYAFTEFGQVISIDHAEKKVNGVDLKYYLFNDLTYELILKDGQIKQKHFAIKTTFFEHQGKKYLIDHASESPQHYDAKLKIIKNGFFRWSDYLIRIKKPRLEKRYSNSFFRADLIAEMESGEEIFIEIIKTSNTSKSKEKFIVENQLPTFKIWIDEQGDFIDESFDFIGNREIEDLRKKYSFFTIEHGKQLQRRAESWKSFKGEKERIDSEIRDLEERLRSTIEREESKLKYFGFRDGRELDKIESGIEKETESAREIWEEIRVLRKAIRSIRRKIENIEFSEAEERTNTELLKKFRKNYGYNTQVTYDT